jgi:hypothetical protein
MSDNGYYVNYDERRGKTVPLSASSSLRYYFNPVSLHTFLIQQRSHALVEGGQSSFLVHRQPKQITIRYLIMSHEAALEVPDGILDWQIVRPKTMCRMVNVES